MRFGLRWLFVGIAIVAVPLAIYQWTREPLFPDPSRGIVAVEIELFSSSDPDKRRRITIHDSALIRTLVVEPLHDFVPEPDPADWVVLGRLVVEYDDGTRDGAILFLPWGHWKFEDRYRIADLTGLRAEVRRQIENGNDPQREKDRLLRNIAP